MINPAIIFTIILVVFLLSCLTYLILGLYGIIDTRSAFTKDVEKDIEIMLKDLAEELQQMENIDVINRVKEEMNQLEIKKQKLSDFIASEKFTTLSDKHQFLLKRQLELQRAYVGILYQRLQLMEDECVSILSKDRIKAQE